MLHERKRRADCEGERVISISVSDSTLKQSQASRYCTHLRTFGALERQQRMQQPVSKQRSCKQRHRKETRAMTTTTTTTTRRTHCP